MIDSHCHLADKQFKDDLDDVLLRAQEHGVDVMVCIADSLREGEKCLELAEKYEQIFCTIGQHPHCASSFDRAQDDSTGDLERLKRMVQSSNKVKAVGEIGLDYHYDNSPRDVQREVFALQLQLANELDLPAVVHNRESIDDLLYIVNEVAPQQMVLHCCTEKWEDVEPLIEKGYFLSFTGIATYPKSEEIRRTIKQCPLEQMMIETDAPYLAPVPHRGKRNEPSFVVEVAKLVAELKDVSLEEVDEVTTKNAVEFFSLSE